MRDGYVYSNGCALYYQMEGEGAQDILFLHGNGENGSIFEPVCRKLRSKYRLFRLDSRGHGRSDYIKGTLSIEKMAEDTICFIQEMGLQKPHLIGFSDGANVAMQTALGHAHLLGKLVLVGGNMTPDGLLPSIRYRICLEEKMLHIKKRLGYSVDKSLECLRLMTKEPRFTTQMLNRIKIDTLVIAGEHDMIQSAHTYQIAKAIPNAVLRIIPDGDHFVFSKRLNRLVEVLQPFLENGDVEKDAEF